jgi:hypothetical protein
MPRRLAIAAGPHFGRQLLELRGIDTDQAGRERPTPGTWALR